MYFRCYPVASQILVLFSFPSCKRNFVLNAWLSMDGSDIPRPPLSIGRKRVSPAIGSRFLLFHRKLKIILFISGSRCLGSGNTLQIYQSLESSIVFIIIVFPLRERCLWFCIFTLFSIFPDDFKLADITSIFKKEDCLNKENYRPAA